MRLGALLGVGLAMAVAAPSPAAAPKRLDGARPVKVSGLRGSLQNPCWSPRGDRLVLTQFTRGYNAGRSIVQVVARSGGPVLRRLSPTDAQSVNLPGSCWNAATDEVTFTSDPEEGDQIFVVPASGGEPRAVTRPPVVAFEPSFSPDGSEIVFERFREGRSEIWKVRTDGGDLTRLTRGYDDRQPNWSPAGDRIVFQRHRRDSEAPTDLYTISPTGGTARNVTRTKSLEETDVSWSPDGKRLVFSSDGSSVDVASLFTIGADGRGRRRLTRTRGVYDGAPAWSPDGSTIAFESRAGDPDGSKGTRIWTIPSPST